ncbi:pyridoxal 5'-phosphate synthase subunit PdxT Ecym_7001 [Eremothecium cymbalariae DBVPG|uniref:glutaminase n=1 Tax=Eremothecium cymbalariae (strain CBS 270.75 / DBVPG 7215 / KCTC 17166 / NRRL Y-17582) TaxID=931890 RepID=G8JVJ5_ERECY|nr:hypothetical protein Ecym_7001 [Eremothecium cymbalariae DBVPG\
MEKTIGVLALQGSFNEHIECLKKCVDEKGYNIEVLTVKTIEQLLKCDSLVIPGGESTTISQIAERTGLYDHLYKFVRTEGKSVWGTCAGMIFLARDVRNQANLLKPLGALDVAVDRNAFGRQLDSFVSDCDFSFWGTQEDSFSAVFIRAPIVSEIYNNERVQVLHKVEKNGQEYIVAVRQGKILGTSFHPELGSDIRFHNWFIEEFVLK